MAELKVVQQQAAGLRRLTQPEAVRVLAIASGKGGVGKSNISANIGRVLAGRKQSVMLMDADLGLANLDVLLGLRPRYDLNDVIGGRRSIEEIILEGPGGIKLVPAASGVERMASLTPAEHVGLVRAFSDLSMPVDVLLIDTAAGIHDSVIRFSQAAHEVLVVACDEPASITDAYALIKVLSRDHGITRFQVVANMVKSASQGRKLYEKLAMVADQYLGICPGYLGHVPYDEALRIAVRRRRLVVDEFPVSKSSMALQRLADHLEDLPVPRGPSGRIEFFMERMLPPQMTRVSNS